MSSYLSSDQAAALRAKDLGFVVDALQQVEDDANTHWLLQCAALVFFMQAGFAMLTAGCVRTKNTKYILLKNLLDACAAALSFWFIGYALAYGGPPDGNPFIGTSGFLLLEGFAKGTDYALWFYQFAFAATAATIVSGAVAERTQMAAYILYSTFITAFVYPVVVHWVWASTGWLSVQNSEPLFGAGFADFAGSAVVHVVGGLCALIGAAVVGPRIGRYTQQGELVDIPGHSTTLQALGTFILWVGWYGFNPGSTLAISGLSLVAARAAVNTTISAASAAVTNIFVIKVTTSNFDLAQALNGTLAGLVSITAGCALVETYAAFAIGAIGSVVYVGFSELTKHRLQIDDVVDAAAVHFACGVWGAISTSWFATQELVADAFGKADVTFFGAFYAPVGRGHQMFLAAIVAIVAIVAWVAVLMVPFFFAVKMAGLLRVHADEEETGMDVSKHDGTPYMPNVHVAHSPPVPA